MRMSRSEYARVWELATALWGRSDRPVFLYLYYFSVNAKKKLSKLVISSGSSRCCISDLEDAEFVKK